MKIYIVIILMLLAVRVSSQEKEPVRKTFGFSMSILSNEAGGDFYLKKLGFIHRRCFKGFVLQTEFNRLMQSEPKSVLYNLENGQHVIHALDFMESNNVVKSQRYFNTQVTLSKGWTNDKINLYLGLGVSIGQSNASLASTVRQASAELDTLGNPILVYNKDGMGTYATASYFHAGVVAKASVEFKLVDRVSLLVQFSPEITGAWRYKTDNSLFTKERYTHLVNSSLEVGVHYRL